MPAPRQARLDAPWSAIIAGSRPRVRRLASLGALALLSLALLPGTALGGLDVSLTDAASGRTISVAPGATITIDLESNASTGYHWVTGTAPDAAILEAASGSGAYTPPGSDLLGASGTQTFRYRAVGHGTTRIVLTYVAPGTGAVGKTFRLTVEVGPAAGPQALPSSTTGGSGGGAPGLILLGLLLAAAGGLCIWAARSRWPRRSA